MKYLSVKYWFELWLWTTPMLNNLLQIINAKAMDSTENIKQWNNKNFSNLELEITSQDSNKLTACVYEAGHTIVALQSQFKNKFQKMEFLSQDNNHYGKTTFDALLPLTPLQNITNSQLTTLLHIDLGGLPLNQSFSILIFLTISSIKQRLMLLVISKITITIIKKSWKIET